MSLNSTILLYPMLVISLSGFVFASHAALPQTVNPVSLDILGSIVQFFSSIINAVSELFTGAPAITSTIPVASATSASTTAVSTTVALTTASSPTSSTPGASNPSTTSQTTSTAQSTSTTTVSGTAPPAIAIIIPSSCAVSSCTVTEGTIVNVSATCYGSISECEVLINSAVGAACTSTPCYWSANTTASYVGNEVFAAKELYPNGTAILSTSNATLTVQGSSSAGTQCSVSVISSDGGTGSALSSNGSVACGAEWVLSESPDSGYMFVNWTCAPSAAASANACYSGTDGDTTFVTNASYSSVTETATFATTTTSTSSTTTTSTSTTSTTVPPAPTIMINYPSSCADASTCLLQTGESFNLTATCSGTAGSSVGDISQCGFNMSTSTTKSNVGACSWPDTVSPCYYNITASQNYTFIAYEKLSNGDGGYLGAPIYSGSPIVINITAS